MSASTGIGQKSRADTNAHVNSKTCCTCSCSAADVSVRHGFAYSNFPFSLSATGSVYYLLYITAFTVYCTHTVYYSASCSNVVYQGKAKESNRSSACSFGLHMEL